MSIRRSVVKWFDAKKGYGFIVHPDGGADIFVHYSAIDSDKRFKTLRTGQVVEFELNDGPKGLHAHNVSPIETEPRAGGLGDAEGAFGSDGSVMEAGWDTEESAGYSNRSVRSGF